MKKQKEFKFGDITDQVWCGDIVTKCEFIQILPNKRLLFWDYTFKCFRYCYWEVLHNEFILNGWDCSAGPSI